MPLPPVRAVVALGAAACLVLAVGRAAASPQPPDDVAGRVTEEGSGKPVAGATVRLWSREKLPAEPGPAFDAPVDLDWPEKPRKSATTGADGRFRFPKESGAALRWVSVSAPGFGTACAEVAAAGAVPDVALTRTAPRKVRVVRVAELGVEPAAGAVLLLFPVAGAPLSERVTVGADGWVSLPYGPEAEAIVRGDGLATKRLGLADGGSEGAELRPLSRGGPVSGTVVVAKGATLAGVRVVIDVGGLVLPASLDGAGTFRTDGVACDARVRATLRVEAPGCEPIARSVVGGDSGIFVHAAAARIRGKAVDEAGKPVAGAVVWVGAISDAASVTDLPPLDSPPSRTGADGAFELEGIAPGPRSILALDARGGATAALPVVVAAGGPVPDVVLRLAVRRQTIRLRCADEKGAALAGVRIEAPGGGAEATTGADGRATLQVPPPGVGLLLRLSGGALGERRLEAQVAPRADLRDDIAVVADSLVKVRVRALNPTGQPIPRAELQVAWFAPEEGPVLALPPAQRVAFGAEEIEIPASHLVRLAVTTMRQDCHWLADVRGGTVPKAGIEARTVRFSEMRTRLPVADAAASYDVWAVPDGPTDVVAGRLVTPGTFDGGEVRVQSLGAGHWYLVVARSSPWPETLFLGRIWVDRATVVEIGAAARPPVTLRGRVASGGRAVGGAVVSFEVTDDVAVSTVSLPDGRWALRLPAIDKGTLTARRTGFGATGVAATATATSDATFELAAAPEARLLLRNARDDWGSPRRLRIRAGGASMSPDPRAFGPDAVLVEGIAAGDVEIDVGEGNAARTVRARAEEGRVTTVDLAAK